MKPSVCQVNVITTGCLSGLYKSTIGLRPGFGIADDNAHRQVGVTANVFGCRMNDNVNANVKGFKEKGSRPGVINNTDDSFFSAGFGNGGHIGHFKRMGARGFQHDKGGIGLKK